MLFRSDDPSFVEELHRRAAAFDAGTTTADDWEVVSQRLRAALDERNPP